MHRPFSPHLPVQHPNRDDANREPSVRSPTVAASEPDKQKATELGSAITSQPLVKLITRLTSNEGDREKPRTKEAESIKLNDMPAPETYRQWRNRVRDEAKSCSDRPDEAWTWLNEVFDTKTPRVELEKKLQEPGKFITLDTKLLAALPRSAKGDLATKIHNFKDENSKKGIQVRGRCVLLMFEDYFKTSEEAGSLYRVEDLLGVVRTGDPVDDLKRFLNRWDATIAGMETPPDDLVLRDILLRQIRKCHLMKYDIEAFDRASEKPGQKSYAFLLQNIKDLLDRERLRSNRNRMVEKTKQGSDKPQPAAPAQGGNPRGKGDRGDRGRGLLENAARVVQEAKFATNLGMGSVTKVRTADSSMSRTPNHDQLPQRTRRVGVRRADHHQRIESPRRRWQTSLAHTSNREIAGGGTSAFTNMRKLLPPQRNPKGPIALHQRKKPVQKLRPASLKGMLVLQMERDCKKVQRP